ncbi:MAG: peptidylprolyl isomerase [Candidatus Paracaedimonas acanthamoebae]|uniref:Peptidylprolyl isomerase n=1 Tax=Candidatus Paracaedimonas acanthamoebae TaxID=244581 RepID=A0A8J7Q041_9PROT|nr:peptidylprolyl isomerase [Candidatus Paracaedimonas acanthamoebae]
MLIEKIRAHSESWWFRSFLGILAITFGFLWYGNDLILGSRGSGMTIASVGGTKITLQQFSRVLNLEINRIEANLNQKLLPDQQKQLYPLVLERLVNDTLLNKEAQRLGLTVTDDFLRRIVTEDKNFHNEKGVFDRERFNVFLSQTGLTEVNFFNEIRQEILRNELLEAIFGGIQAPASLVQRIYAFIEQKRLISFATIESAKIKLDREPSPEEVEGFYDKHHSLFTAPEYRDISVLTLNISNVMPLIKLGEEQIKQAYESRLEEFKGQDFAKVKDKIVDDLRKQIAADRLYELTNKIDDDIGGGATLEEVSKKYQIPMSQITKVAHDGNPSSDTLNFKDQLNDKVLALKVIKDAFQQTLNVVGNVVEAGESKYFIARVDKIYLSQLFPFDQVKKEVYKALVSQMKGQKAANLGMQWVEKINQGGNLEALAGLQGFKVSHLKIGRQGPIAPSNIRFSDEFLSKLYLLPKKVAAATSLLNDKGEKDIIVATVKDIEAVSIERAKNEIAGFKTRMNQELANDLLIQYLESIRQRFSVDYNKKLFAQLMSAKS